MQIFKDYVLCTDMDFTLLDDNKVLSKKNIDAINYFKSEGGKFTLATGRIMKSIDYYLNFVSVDLPVIVHSGAAIYDTMQGREVLNCSVGKDAYKLAEYAVGKYSDISVELLVENEVYIYNIDDSERKHMESLKTEYTEISKFDKDLHPYRICFQGNKDTISALIKDVKNSKFYNMFQCVPSENTIFEILNKEANKGFALSNLCRLYNIDPKKVISVGDNENDIEMLKYAGFSFAPANAVDSAKKFSDYIGPSNNEGIIDFVMKKMEKILNV